MESIYGKAYGETQEQYLWRLGTAKEAGYFNITWEKIAELMNDAFCPDAPKDEATYRKRYRRMQDRMMMDDSNSNIVDINEMRARREKSEAPKAEAKEAASEAEGKEEKKPSSGKKILIFRAPVSESNKEEEEETVVDDSDVNVINLFREAEKERVRLRDERTSYTRVVRQSARAEALFDLFREEIRKYPATEPTPRMRIDGDTKEYAVYALLGDVHYGLEFNNRAGKYSPELAEERIMEYANEIVAIGERYNASVCYVSLLGDMISGNIHSTVRAENRENVVAQTIGVAELVAKFLYVLNKYFEHINVNSVSGNHSRLDLSAEDALRGEKLDCLIPWYCKAKLQNIKGVHFCENTIDSTVADFQIEGNNFIAVHGDYDKDPDQTAQRIERNIGGHVDYVVAGHLHVPAMNMKRTSFIRNGSVCGSGDEFTMKKRLFGPPCQVVLVVSEDGVESVHPVILDKKEAAV